MVPVKPSRDIYEISLDLAPMSNGVLVGTQSNWSEEQIKDNERYIFTPTHEGTIQLGESPNKWGQTHNRAIRLVGYAEGTHELNLLLENVLGMGRSIIEDGIDMEDGTSHYADLGNFVTENITDPDKVISIIEGISNKPTIDLDNGEIFNVGTGEATDILTVANTLIKAYGIDVPVAVTGNFRLGDIRHNFADLTKINSKLSFVPQVSFEQGIKKFTDWVLQQEVQEDHLEKSLEEMKKKGLYKQSNNV
jgi:hypothetical protein